MCVCVCVCVLQFSWESLLGGDCFFAEETNKTAIRGFAYTWADSWQTSQTGKRTFDTVDGRNPAPVDMVNIPLFTGFHTCQVAQDFFHQQ